MNYIIKRIVGLIKDKEPAPGGEAIILINGFEDLSVYAGICRELESLYLNSPLSIRIKLAKKKWDELKEASDPTTIQLMEARGWIAEKESVTFYRNLHDANILILLGTEEEEDTGGLKNCFTIDPDWMISSINGRYSDIFRDCFTDELAPEDESCINAAYGALFTYVPIDICRLSRTADSWNGHLSTINDFCEEFGKNLYKWELPGWFSKSLSPRIVKKKGFLRDNYNFITRKAFQRLTQRSYKSLEDKLEKFAEYPEAEEIDWNAYGFQDYIDFQECLLSFVCGERVVENRKRLLTFDFSIIEKIQLIKGTEPIGPNVRTKASVTGEPMEALLNAGIKMFKQAVTSRVEGISKLHFSFEHAEIVTGYTDANDDEKKATLLRTWRNICSHVNGFFEFISRNNWTICGDQVYIICDTEGFFDPQKAGELLQNKVNAASATNTLNKIVFTVSICDGEDNPILVEENGITHKLSVEYEWKFDNDASWLYDFRDLTGEEYPLGSQRIPVGTMEHIRSTLLSKSDEEFFDSYDENAPSLNFDMQKYVSDRVNPINAQVIEMEMLFEKLGRAFCEFGRNLKEKGFYNCLIGESRSNFIKQYNQLADKIVNYYFAENERWLMDAFLQSFVILEKNNYIEREEDPSCVIVPPWHPVALQKIADQKQFIVDGLSQALGTYNRTQFQKLNVEQLVDHFMQMTEIQSAIDLFPTTRGGYIGVIGSYGNFCLYGDTRYIRETKMRIRDIIRKEAIFDDEFRTSDLTRMNEDAKMFFDIFMDYIKAMPSVKDKLSIVFINPSNLQPIIAAVSKYAETMRNDSEVSRVDMQLSILVRPENKGGKNYLTYWMNEYFSEDEGINVRVFLNVWKDRNELKKLLTDNNDIVINMDIMHEESFWFTPYGGGAGVRIDECRFPIVYKPSPVSQTSIKRKIELSQPQFSASFKHTQIARYKHHADTKPEGTFLAALDSKVDDKTKKIISMLHEKAYWVVCIDRVMDGALLRSESGDDNYSIIGFSTGKGMYGQYNLTITARNSIHATIRAQLKNRLYRLFKWKPEILDNAVDRLMGEARSLDGISILSAVNQKGTNINEFMAYVMTSLRERDATADSALRVIIHLDSYKHWFYESRTEGPSLRPDFLVLSVEDFREKLKLRARITECKTASYHNSDIHIEKALTQVKHGKEQLSSLFDPESESIERRYWFAQLYRALVFAQVTFTNNSEEYQELSEKLRAILDGNFEIEWDYDILGYWIDKPGKEEVVQNIDGITIHHIPQERIQNIILGSEETTYVALDPVLMETLEDDDDNTRHMMAQENMRREEEKILTRKRSRNSEEPVEKETKRSDTNQEERQVVKIEYLEHTPEKNTEKEEVRDAENNNTAEPKEQCAHDVIEKHNNIEDIRVLLGKDRLESDVYWEFGNKGLSNRHLLITGTSGQGKTYGIQTMLYEISKTHISTVVFDYTEGFREDQLEKKFLDKMQGRIDNRVVYFVGVPINPFKRHEIEVAGMRAPEKISDVAQRIASTLSHVYDFGDQQFAAIYEACSTGLEKYGDLMSMKRLEEELNASENKSAKSVVSKMKPFVNSVDFSSTECDWNDILYNEEGRLTIFQLTNFVRDIQVIITEFMLWDMWHYTKKNGNKDKPFIVVLDEAQNLSHAANSPSGLILTEGRKFGWSAWYATQSLKVLNDDEITRLMQAAFKLNFKPTAAEVTSMAKQLNPTDANEWKNPLINLKKGECIVVGDRIQRDGKFKAGKPTVTRVTPFEKR